MEEVQIHISRLTRFVDILVKFVTFISILLFLLCFYIYRYQAGEIYKKQVALCDTVWSQGMTNSNPLENPIQSAFLGVKANCMEQATANVSMWSKLVFMFFDISIILPLIYFGGQKLVKDTTNIYLKKKSLISS
jgi:hypothetical protein